MHTVGPKRHRRTETERGSVSTVSDDIAAGLEPRLTQQLAFLLEIDQLKQVLRQSLLADGSRRENTAEHSWHLALCALVLAEHANEPVDVAKVITMLLIHDLVEIDAGDTFIYAIHGQANADANSPNHGRQAADRQASAEQAAADRIFALLPSEQAETLRTLWDEFEGKITAESRFAKAVDRLQPMLLNHAAGGGAWKVHGITADRPRRLIDDTIPPGSVTLAALAHHVIDQSVASGALLPPA